MGIDGLHERCVEWPSSFTCLAGEQEAKKVERIRGRELLRLDFPEGSPASTLWVRMKPDVAVLWSYDGTG
ncbi:hypothetical protein ACQEVZ_46580 [Dactylosporangium sp. CA-152071]|uniref:hypothetical protein n=1 Tax=Dactylosporangium sp. CA-152071 TaxID=3239933 RepID=UPI003D8D90D8